MIIKTFQGLAIFFVFLPGYLWIYWKDIQVIDLWRQRTIYELCFVYWGTKELQSQRRDGLRLSREPYVGRRFHNGFRTESPLLNHGVRVPVPVTET